MRENDLIDRLESADPAAALAPATDEELRRRMDAITAAPRPRRPWPRLVLAAAAGACAIVAALALLPTQGSPRVPGPVAALAAELTRPGAIVHYVSESQMVRIEAWVAVDGSASRELSRLGPAGAVMETVVHGHRAAVYSQRDDRLTRIAHVARAPSSLCWPCLVARLQRSERQGLLRPIGDAVVDGREVVVLRLAGSGSARLFVAKADGALVRIALDTRRGTLRQDFSAFEVLDDTPAHRRLLEMSPHPDAHIADRATGELP
jgi:hypothetical protein